MVALHPTTRDALEHYLVARRRERTPHGHLFVLATGRPPSRWAATKTFRKLAEQTGLRDPSAPRGPTPHSLRHAFAVRSLENLARDADPSRHMLALATYLGHSEIAHTYWYLEATPVLLRGIAEATERAHREGQLMTDLAPHVTAFLRDHLPHERRFSRHTVQSYTESLKRLVVHASARLDIRPSTLTVEHFTVPVVLGFLDSLERERNNCIGTRNTRLAAIKAFFRYLEYRVPACLDQALQIRAIPLKRADKPLIDWLDHKEMQALLDAPDNTTVAGLRDRAMLHLCYAAGLRVSELLALTLGSLSGPRLETIRIIGKGRRERELPLWKETRSVLDTWLDVRPRVNNDSLFLNARGRAMSRDGFAHRLALHAVTAARTVPSIAAKRVTPHVVRHSTAMAILRATGDVRKVSLWLGHADIRTTEIYLRASPMEKLEILAAHTPPEIRPGAFPGAQDSLMRLLNGM